MPITASKAKNSPPGSLLTIDNQIDPNSGTVRLRAEFPNKDHALFPNQFVNARLLLETRRGATVVPTAAIQRSPQATFVYLVKADQTVTVRQVRLGPTEGDNTAIDEGLSPGDLVVVEGAERLREGSKVELKGQGPGNRRRGKASNESFPHLHPAPGGDHPADGGHSAGRRRGLPPVAGFRPAPGGLPHHPGAHLFPGGQPRRHGLLRHRAPGAPVRADAGAEADDLQQLRRQFGHHPAVQSEPQPGRGRTGGAGGHQCRGHLPAQRPAQSAGLQQGQSGGCADPDAGPHFRYPAAAQGRRPGGYPAGPEDLPTAGRGASQHQRRPAAGGADSGQPHGPGRLWPDPGGPAHRHCRGQHQPGQGRL